MLLKLSFVHLLFEVIVILNVFNCSTEGCVFTSFTLLKRNGSEVSWPRFNLSIFIFVILLRWRTLFLVFICGSWNFYAWIFCWFKFFIVQFMILRLDGSHSSLSIFLNVRISNSYIGSCLEENLFAFSCLHSCCVEISWFCFNFTIFIFSRRLGFIFVSLTNGSGYWLRKETKTLSKEN
jgi:hypothetical protein